MWLPLRKYGSGVVEEDTLQSNPVDKVQPGRGDHPVEVVRGWAGGLVGDLVEEEKEEGKARKSDKGYRRP